MNQELLTKLNSLKPGTLIFGDDGYRSSHRLVWYYTNLANRYPSLTVADLKFAHRFLCRSAATPWDTVGIMHVGEFWAHDCKSVNAYLDFLHLHHTSFSTGDVIADGEDHLISNGYELTALASWKINDAEYVHLCFLAEAWRFLQSKMNSRQTKADLDFWLMSRFALTPSQARMVSNGSIDTMAFWVGDGGARWVSKLKPEPLPALLHGYLEGSWAWPDGTQRSPMATTPAVFGEVKRC